MATTETQPWDVVDYLETDEDQVAYLAAVLEGVVKEGAPEFVAVALVDIARARGIEGALEKELHSQVGGGEAAARPEPVGSAAN